MRAAGSTDGGHGVAKVGVDVERVRCVRDFNGGSGCLCLGEGLGYGQGDILAPVIDDFIFKGWPLLAVPTAGGVTEDRVEVAVVKDSDDARHLLSRGGVDAADLAAGDGSTDGNGIDHSREVVIRGVPCRAGGLEGTIDARERSSDDGGRLGDGGHDLAVGAKLVGLDELEKLVE